VRTLQFALEPLLAKSEMRTGWHRDGLALDPYLVNPVKTGELRARIRTILVREGSGALLRRAYEAVDLLGDALDEPVQYVGMPLAPAKIFGWEPEDLATLTAMTTVARTTAEPLVRRQLRSRVAWHATRAKPHAMRAAALTLATELDEHPEDDLTAALLGAHDYLLPSRRGIPPDGEPPTDTQAAADDGRAAALLAKWWPRGGRRESAGVVFSEDAGSRATPRGRPTAGPRWCRYR